MTTEQMDDVDAIHAGFKDAADQRAHQQADWKRVADSADGVIRAVLIELGFEPGSDPILAARKRMQQLAKFLSEHSDTPTVLSTSASKEEIAEAMAHSVNGVLLVPDELWLDKKPEPIESDEDYLSRAAKPEIGQATEPIEDRLRRAWLNGFTEGVNRGAWGDQRWDR